MLMRFMYGLLCYLATFSILASHMQYLELLEEERFSDACSLLRLPAKNGDTLARGLIFELITAGYCHKDGDNLQLYRLTSWPNSKGYIDASLLMGSIKKFNNEDDKIEFKKYINNNNPHALYLAYKYQNIIDFNFLEKKTTKREKKRNITIIEKPNFDIYLQKAAIQGHIGAIIERKGLPLKEMVISLDDLKKLIHMDCDLIPWVVNFRQKKNDFKDKIVNLIEKIEFIKNGQEYLWINLSKNNTFENMNILIQNYFKLCDDLLPTINMLERLDVEDYKAVIWQSMAMRKMIKNGNMLYYIEIFEANNRFLMKNPSIFSQENKNIKFFDDTYLQLLKNWYINQLLLLEYINAFKDQFPEQYKTIIYAMSNEEHNITISIKDSLVNMVKFFLDIYYLRQNEDGNKMFYFLLEQGKQNYTIASILYKDYLNGLWPKNLELNTDSEALQIIEFLSKERIDNPEYWYALAEHYKKMGNNLQALASHAKAFGLGKLESAIQINYIALSVISQAYHEQNWEKIDHYETISLMFLSKAKDLGLKYAKYLYLFRTDLISFKNHMLDLPIDSITMDLAEVNFYPNWASMYFNAAIVCINYDEEKKCFDLLKNASHLCKLADKNINDSTKIIKLFISVLLGDEEKINKLTNKLEKTNTQEDIDSYIHMFKEIVLHKEEKIEEPILIYEEKEENNNISIRKILKEKKEKKCSKNSIEALQELLDNKNLKNWKRTKLIKKAIKIIGGKICNSYSGSRRKIGQNKKAGKRYQDHEAKNKNLSHKYQYDQFYEWILGFPEINILIESGQLSLPNK